MQDLPSICAEIYDLSEALLVLSITDEWELMVQQETRRAALLAKVFAIELTKDHEYELEQLRSMISRVQVLDASVMDNIRLAKANTAADIENIKNHQLAEKAYSKFLQD